MCLLAAAAASPNPCEARGACRSRNSIRWLAYYGERADEAVLATYDLVVLDPGFRGPIKLVTEAGVRVCGYLSLAEIKTSDPFLAFLDRQGLLDDNLDWPGTHRVDIRCPSWRSLVLDKKIPSIVAQGFTGLMLDTVDTPSYLELMNPDRFRGMRAAAIELIGTIRARWPEMTLIMNRGYAVLPDVREKIDAVIAESLITAPDPQTGGYYRVDARQVELQLALLKPVVHRDPPLPVLSLDYWIPDDAVTIAEIYRRERALCHHPYVATRLLNQIIPEIR